MKVEKIKIGTKVKLLAQCNAWQEAGTIGTITAGTMFHEGDNITDTNGAYWIAAKEGPFDRYCIGDNTSLFKILKY